MTHFGNHVRLTLCSPIIDFTPSLDEAEALGRNILAAVEEGRRFEMKHNTEKGD